MDAEAIRELFEPFGPVRIGRMFGGHGIHADDLFFALEAFGEIWLKADAETRPAFEAAGSAPFSYQKKTGTTIVTALWRLPAECYDDPDAMRRWAAMGLEAARRSALAKAGAPKRRAPKRRDPLAKDTASQ